MGVPHLEDCLDCVPNGAYQCDDQAQHKRRLTQDDLQEGGGSSGNCLHAVGLWVYRILRVDLVAYLMAYPIARHSHHEAQHDMRFKQEIGVVWGLNPI